MDIHSTFTPGFSSTSLNNTTGAESQSKHLLQWKSATYPNLPEIPLPTPFMNPFVASNALNGIVTKTLPAHATCILSWLLSLAYSHLSPHNLCLSNVWWQKITMKCLNFHIRFQFRKHTILLNRVKYILKDVFPRTRTRTCNQNDVVMFLWKNLVVFGKFNLNSALFYIKYSCISIHWPKIATSYRHIKSLVHYRSFANSHPSLINSLTLMQALVF